MEKLMKYNMLKLTFSILMLFFLLTQVAFGQSTRPIWERNEVPRVKAEDVDFAFNADK